MAESKMRVSHLPRNVPPRITETDVVRMTDDGRPFPPNSINTKQHRKGTLHFIPVLFGMQFKYIAYWATILDIIVQALASLYYDDYASIEYYAGLIVVVLIFIYVREYNSEKKRDLMDKR